MSTYKLTVKNDSITVNSTTTEYGVSVSPVSHSVSLSRTGGQGAKGDSVSNVYMVNNVLYVEISDGAGNVIETINAGDLASIINEGISLDNLSNVAILTPSTGQALVYNGAEWVNTTIAQTLNELTDVDTLGLANGDVLNYNSVTGNWEVLTLSDNYYTNVEVDGIVSGKSDNGHVHDDRYYRKSEVDASLATKSNTNHTHTLAELTDTSILTPVGDQVLRYDGADWVNSNLALSDISDFVIDPLVVSGEILRWNGTNWINNTLTEAGIAAASHTHTISEVTDFTDNSVNWDTAFSWGNHATAGYLTGISANAVTEDKLDIINTGVDGYALTFDSATGRMEWSAVSSSVGGLSDVDLTGLAAGNVLSYNNVSGNWEVENLGDTYYTEGEVITLLAGKSDTTHNHAGVYEPADATILKDADIGVTVQGYDASIVVDADIGVTVQGYNVNTVIDSAYIHTDNNYTTTEKNKLSGIEAGATADQTKADIDALGINAATLDGIDSTGFALVSHTHTGVYEPADATILKDADIGVTVQGYNANYVIDASYVHTDNNYTTTEKSKLAGIETGADVTDTINVTAAGALMDSEVTNLAQVKAFNSADYATSGHNHTLDSLSNTTITTNSAGEILKWSGTAWINNTLAEAGIQPAGSYAAASHTHTASQITDFDTEVSNNTSVAANTAKVSNVSTNLSTTAAPTTITINSSDGTNAIIAAADITNAGVMTTTMYDQHVLNNAKITNATHTGEVTGSTTLTIASNVVDADNLNVVGNGTTAQYLRSDGDGSFTWATPTDTTANETITLSGDLTGSGTTSINAQLAANVVNANELNVVGNGTTSQYLRSDGDGSFTWATLTDTNTTYSAGTNMSLVGTVFSVVDSPTFTTVTATDFNTTSDISLKENITDIDNALDKVSRLRGTEFDWKATGEHTVGFIAQEVEAVVPELVGTNEETGIKSVKYGNVTALLVEAIKELKEEVAELKRQLNNK